MIFLKITFTTTPESPICKDRDEWSAFLAKRVSKKATPVKVWWFTHTVIPSPSLYVIPSPSLVIPSEARNLIILLGTRNPELVSGLLRDFVPRNDIFEKGGLNAYSF